MAFWNLSCLWQDLVGDGAYLIVTGLFFGTLLSWQIYRWMRKECQHEHGDDHVKLQSEPLLDQATLNKRIIPLPGFAWQETKPLQYRPFKPKTHLTMALSNSSISELIEMDWNYSTRIQLRRQIMRDHEEITIGADPEVKPSVDEFYVWLFGSYLPTRFPSMFQLQSSPHSPSIKEDFVLNLVTSEEISLHPPLAITDCLRMIGSHVDDDFLFLLPSPDGDGYSLQSYVTCFPSGFNTKEKLYLKLRDIHHQVPGYKKKLGKSMDRFFDRIEVGRFVKRTNWTITTTNKLFSPFGTHLYEGEQAEKEDIDIDKAHLRVERQVLHRLPISKALIFSFKTYLYPLIELKKEGLGEDLAVAIEGLQNGSVPELHFYKRAAVWGDSVKSYLRSNN